MNILVVGGGIASCHIIHQLLQHEVSITLYSDINEYPNSSMVAGASLVPVNIRKSGVDVIDPILFQQIVNQYRSIEQRLGQVILQSLPLKIFTKDKDSKIHATHDRLVEYSYYLDIRSLLKSSLEYWKGKINVYDEAFEYKDLVITDKGVKYGGEHYDQVVFAEGIGVEQNPFFQAMPFNENWGQVLILEIENLSRQYIYHHHHRLLPIENNQWWYGAPHLWSQPTDEQSHLWVEEQKRLLKNWLDTPFEISKMVTHRRPTTPGQFPYIGRHPKYLQLYIMNGLGSRGMMHSARYAEGLVDMMLGKSSEIPGYDNKKFQSLLR